MMAVAGVLLVTKRGQWEPAWRFESSPAGLTGRGRRLAVGGQGNLLGLRKRTSGVGNTQGKVVALGPLLGRPGYLARTGILFLQMQRD
jgi:hypothetical protein